MIHLNTHLSERNEDVNEVDDSFEHTHQDVNEVDDSFEHTFTKRNEDVNEVDDYQTEK